MLARLQAGEAIPLDEFCEGWDAITQLIIERAASSRSPRRWRAARSSCRVPDTGAAADDDGREDPGAPRRSARRRAASTSSPATRWCVDVDGGYTHEFTTAQVHYFLEQEYGAGLHDRRTRRSSPSSRTT